MTKSMGFKTGYWLAAALACPLLIGCGWIDLGGDQAIGRPCDLRVSASPNEAVFATDVAECPSNLCLKPAYQSNAVGDSGAGLGTGPSCSAECSDDSDCEGELRDPNAPADSRCSKGFACAVPFVKGPLCCKRLCVCKDFLGPAGAPLPIACEGEGAKTCSQAVGEEPSSGVEQVTDIYISVASARQVDLVTMVDNSPGMAGKVTKLNAAFPALIEALRDPLDGTLPDLRVAIIDSDLGTGGAFGEGACAAKKLDDGTLSLFGDLGRFQMRSLPTACPITPGWRFLDSKAGLPLSYTGDLGTVFACLTSNLGESGCFEEHQLQAFEFALAAQGVGNEAQQAGFLRPSAQLGLIFLTDEDDCSAATNDALFGDLPAARGESASLRCATRAHRCGGSNLASASPGYPTQTAFTAPFASCQARLGDECDLNVDTSQPTACNPLRNTHILASELKALKRDWRNELVVAGIFGWPRSAADMAVAEYKIAPVPNPNTADTSHPTVFDYWPVCYDPNHLPSPATTDPVTGFDATAAAWGATGGLRESAFIDEFGANGWKFSICEPDFGLVMTTIGGAIARKMQSVCFDQRLMDSDPVAPGIQADCRVVWRMPRILPQTGAIVYEESPTSMPQCLPGSVDGAVATDCWQLVTDATVCPTSGQRIAVLRTAAERAASPQLPAGTKVGMQCRTCPVLAATATAQPGCDY